MDDGAVLTPAPAVMAFAPAEAAVVLELQPEPAVVVPAPSTPEVTEPAWVDPAPVLPSAEPAPAPAVQVSPVLPFGWPGETLAERVEPALARSEPVVVRFDLPMPVQGQGPASAEQPQRLWQGWDAARSESTGRRDWKTAFVTRLGADSPADANAGLRITLPVEARTSPTLSRLARR